MWAYVKAGGVQFIAQEQEETVADTTEVENVKLQINCQTEKVSEDEPQS